MLVSVVVFTGCSQGLNSDSSKLSSTGNSQSASESKAESSMEESSDLSVDPSGNSEIDNENVIGDMTYYLDKSKVLSKGTLIGYMLQSKDNKNGKEESLDIVADSIKVYGDQLFVLSSISENNQNPIEGLDNIYRLNKNGKYAFVCSGHFFNNIEGAIYNSGEYLYFTRVNENAIFKTKMNSEKIERIPVVIPNENELKEEVKLTTKDKLTTEVSIYQEEEGFILFSYSISDEKNPQFLGHYRMSINDYHIEKFNTQFLDNRRFIGDWVYYLDFDNPIEADETNEETLYDIHKMKIDGSRDSNLNIPCFAFDICGEYIYAEADITYGDFRHWSTYRYKIDGSGKKMLDYDDMIRLADGNDLYFTQMWSDIIYIADSACNVLKKFKVSVPDESELRAKLGDLYDLVEISIIDKEGDWLSFDYIVGDPGGYYYFAVYRVNLKSKIIEKISGEFDLPETDAQ